MKPVHFSVLFGILSASLIFSACTPTQKGATGGAAIGAGTGALIGNQSGNAGEGALIGAAVGGLSGALIGDSNQKNSGVPHSHGDYTHSHPGGEAPHTHTQAPGY